MVIEVEQLQQTRRVGVGDDRRVLRIVGIGPAGEALGAVLVERGAVVNRDHRHRLGDDQLDLVHQRLLLGPVLDLRVLVEELHHLGILPMRRGEAALAEIS